MTGPVDLVRAVVALPIAASEALASLPRLVRALERLADPAGPLAQASSVRVPLENLAEGGGALDRLADVSATLERLATLDRSLSKLGELGPTLARIDDLSESVRQIAELEESLLKLSGLADTMTDLHESVAALAATVAPLQGTTERLGRLVDRIPSRRARRAIPPPIQLPSGDPFGSEAHHSARPRV
jgi:hypothetical protein